MGKLRLNKETCYQVSDTRRRTTLHPVWKTYKFDKDWLNQLANLINNNLTTNIKQRYKDFSVAYIMERLEQYTSVENNTYITKAILEERINVLKRIFAVFNQKKIIDPTINFNPTKEQKELLADKLYEGLVECKDGFHTRTEHIWLFWGIKLDFNARLQTIRQDIVTRVSMKLYNEVHAQNSVSKIAKDMGYGTEVINPNDSYRGNIDPSLIREELRAAFERYYTPLMIIKGIEEQLFSEFVYLGNYLGRRAEYTVGSRSKWLELLEKVFPELQKKNNNEETCLLMDYNDYNIDINWPFIRKLICNHLIGKKFFDCSTIDQFNPPLDKEREFEHRVALAETEKLDYCVNPANEEEFYYWSIYIADQNSSEDQEFFRNWCLWFLEQAQTQNKNGLIPLLHLLNILPAERDSFRQRLKKLISINLSHNISMRNFKTIYSHDPKLLKTLFKIIGQLNAQLQIKHLCQCKAGGHIDKLNILTLLASSPSTLPILQSVFNLVHQLDTLSQYIIFRKWLEQLCSSPDTMMVPAKIGYLPLVQALIEDNPKERIDVVNCLGQSQLLLAIIKGHVDVAEYLIKKGANLEFPTNKHDKKLSYTQKHGETPLYWAVLNKDTHMVELLCQAGAKTSIKSSSIQKHQPIYVAIKNGDVAIIEILLKYNPNLIEQLDSDGKTPLCYAVEVGHIDIVRLLCEKNRTKTNTDAPIPKDPPIHIAVKKGNLEMVKILLEYNPTLKNKLNGNAESPLWLAITKSDIGIVNYLLSLEVDINHPLYCPYKNNHGKTPLSLAIELGNPDIVQQLCKAGAANITKLSTPHENDPTLPTYLPIHQAIEQGRLDLVKILLEYSPSLVNQRNHFNRNPLFMAASTGQLTIAKHFLNQYKQPGAQFQLDAHRDALQVAVSNGHTAIVKLFLRYGIKPTANKQIDRSTIKSSQLSPRVKQELKGITKLANYIPKRNSSKEPEYKWSYFRGISRFFGYNFSKSEKVAAATALQEVIINNTKSLESLKPHMSALKNGTLQSIYKKLSPILEKRGLSNRL